MSEPRLRRSEVSDAEQLGELLARVFPGSPKADRDVMRWQYWGSPYGDPFGFVWEADGRIVGHYTSVPVPVLIGGERTLGAVGMDAAVLPEWRGRGLHTRLVDVHVAAQAERGAVVVLFFPGPSTGLPKAILARSCMVPLRVFVLPVKSPWLAARLRVPVAVGELALRAALRRPRIGLAQEVEGPPDEVDGLWDEVAPVLPYSIVKDATWWRWRFGQRPRSRYRYFAERKEGRLRAVAVVRVREAHGGQIAYVLELLAADALSARHVLGAATGATDADAVAMCAPRHSPHARWARAGGLRVLPRRLEREPLSLAAFQVLVDVEPPFGPWVATWGDMDHL